MDNQNPDNQTPPVSPMPPVGDKANGPNQSPPKGLMETLEYYFVTKAPFQIPSKIREGIVKVTPWLNVIFLLTIIPLALTVLGLGTLFTFYAGAYWHHGWSLYNIINLVCLILGFMALPGLFKREEAGWRFTFCEISLSFVASLIVGNVIGGLFSLVVGYYFLFQIKSYYN